MPTTKPEHAARGPQMDTRKALIAREIIAAKIILIDPESGPSCREIAQRFLAQHA